MSIPKNAADKEHILKALAAIDQEGVPWHRQSTKFDLIYGEKEYPPKYVVSVAFKFATGSELRQSSGGAETNVFLKKLGFEIKEIKCSQDFGVVRFPGPRQLSGDRLMLRWILLSVPSVTAR